MRLQGVVSTGIYCRANCKARPLPENVRPMRNAAEALASGFRPCLICRPDRLPDLGFAAQAGELEHALRLIAEGFLDTATTDELARRIGYSTRHLLRLFETRIGASPDFVARANRAHLARRLLDESDLTITSVAFAAGFSSVRQMNRVMRELFRFTPSELRSKRASTDTFDPLDGGLRLRLPYGGRLAGSRLIDYLGSRAIPGIENVEHGRYRRTIQTCGFPGVLEVVDPRDGRHLELTLHLATFGSIIEQVERARRLFGIDRDTSAATRLLRRDPLLGPLVRRQPGLRMLGAWDRFETAIRIIIGQQVSVAGASTVSGRLVERFGERIDVPLPGTLRFLFPRPEVLARAGEQDLGMPRARARTIARFSEAVASGKIDLSRPGPVEGVAGIGPWSANLIAARVTGDPDAFPASDLGLRKSAARLIGRTRPLVTGELEQLAETWRPHRTTAAAYLWMTDPSDTGAPPEEKRSPADVED